MHVDSTNGGVSNKLRNGAAVVLFLAVCYLFWVTTKPFIDLTDPATLDPSAEKSNLVNQLVTLAVSGGLLLFGLTSPLRSTILQPRLLLICLFVWFFFVSAISTYPDLALKRVVLAILTCINAAVFLILPRSDRQFAQLLGVAMLAVLGLAYFGVTFIPSRAIHLATELREPMNAGFWRGQFAHKNEAAGVMVLTAFFGFYVYATWHKFLGVALVVLAAFFLMHTGGKTSSAALPAIVLLAWMFERWSWLRIPLSIGGIIAMNTITIGSAISEPIRSLVSAVGVDPTFTNRTDIWRFAFSAITQRPLFGYGFQLFWQTDELVYSGGGVETWAVEAFNGHNAYLDSLLTTGIPGLVLTVFWLVILPLRDFGQAEKTGNNPALTRLFLRIWLYGIYTACVESFFFLSGASIWFVLLIAVFGLRLQARASVVSETSKPITDTVSHA